MTIPEGFIENAKHYVLISPDGEEPIEVGGPIMMNMIVREQMDMDKILATSGVTNEECIIIVAYTPQQIRTFITKARVRLMKIRQS